MTFALILPSDAAALYGFRVTLNDWLRSLPLSDELCVALLLAGHEAAANGVEHSTGPVTIDGRFANNRVILEITTTGKWGALGEPASEERGRGMLILKALVPDLEVIPLHAGNMVRLQASTSATT
jgi:anti-sigma regulatory factor (Ser/Thr protein kinase)